MKDRMDKYRLLAEITLPGGILDWFDVTDVRVVKKNEDERALHIYLDENADKPDNMDNLRPNGFTREGVFTDFPLRDQEVLLHVRRRRWLDENGESVMTDMDLIQEHTRCSKEFAAFLKEAAGHSPDKWADTQKERAEILWRIAQKKHPF